jgi:hypothetical protein
MHPVALDSPLASAVARLLADMTAVRTRGRALDGEGEGEGAAAAAPPSAVDTAGTMVDIKGDGGEEQRLSQLQSTKKKVSEIRKQKGCSSDHCSVQLQWRACGRRNTQG